MIPLIALSFMAGAVHVTAPDHWMSFSLLGWRKRWSGGRVLFLGSCAYLIHVLAGFALLLAIRPWLSRLDGREFLWGSVAFVLVCGAIRSFRFERIREMLRPKASGWQALLAPLALLGPCEAIIPICFKSAAGGRGYLDALLAFSLGTLLAGGALLSYGRLAWNEPIRLVQSIAWTARRLAALPALVIVSAGLFVLIRLGH